MPALITLYAYMYTICARSCMLIHFCFFQIYLFIFVHRLLALVVFSILFFFIFLFHFCKAAAIKSGTLIDNKRLFSFCQLFVFVMRWSFQSSVIRIYIYFFSHLVFMFTEFSECISSSFFLLFFLNTRPVYMQYVMDNANYKLSLHMQFRLYGIHITQERL